MHEQPSADADLRNRVVNRQRRGARDVLVIHVCDDADDAARIRLGSEVGSVHHIL